MISPNRPDHADKTESISGADPRFTVTRRLSGYAYPRNGNVHNPTPRYVWLLKVDGITVDQGPKRVPLIDAARNNGAAYLAEIDARRCDCMTENPGDGYGERVVTHSARCPLHPDA